jgi:O-antigen/teichoic acid export membrane protein
MRRKIIIDISASTLQILINQFSGVAVFYILSKYLSKSVFGEINWSVALIVIIFNILSFGIDQIVVRRIAVGDDPSAVLSIHFTHVLATSLLFFGLLLSTRFLFRTFFAEHYLLLWIAISQLFLFLSTPFKQMVNGKELFRPLMIMSVISNIIRLSSLLLLALLQNIAIITIIYVLVVSTVMEFLVCAGIVHGYVKIPIALAWNRSKYYSLIKESLPQLGVILFNAALQRFDWILLGLLASQAVLAEYSFAYRAFEISALPLFIIAPLLLPRFTRYFNKLSPPDGKMQKLDDLLVLLRLSIVLACLTSLLVNLLWVQVIDGITDNKYGAVNSTNILILSAALPFMYLNNFLWTMHFATGRLNRILLVTVITLGVNVFGDLLLIPLFGAEGAAIAILIAFIIQSVLYSQKAHLPGLGKTWQTMLFCVFSAALSGWLAKQGFENLKFSLATALLSYTLILIVAKQIKLIDWFIVKRIIR